MVDFPVASTPRPHTNAVVIPHPKFHPEERLRAAASAGWNVFHFPAEMATYGDFLSDSGTGAFTLEQVVGMLKGLGSKAYGSRPSYFVLLDALNKYLCDISGDELFLTPQGRVAEWLFFSTLRDTLDHSCVVPSNGHFDTTRANVEGKCVRFRALDLPVSQTSPVIFRGDMDVDALRACFEREREVPAVFLTITNNTYGGAPVSFENMLRVRSLCCEHDASFFLDACRFAENAFFVTEYEPGMRQLAVPDAVRRALTLCDGFTISFKKDGLSDIGGALVVKKKSPLVKRYPNFLNELRVNQTGKIAHQTQGGMTGASHFAIATGLSVTTTKEYLAHRVALTAHFARLLRERDVPIVDSVGGHAVYIDVDRFFEGTRLCREDFGGVALTGLLLLKGIRACELGAYAFGKYDAEAGEETFPPFNFVRLAIPRITYEREDFVYAADCIAGLYNIRHHLPRAVPVSGRGAPLRHFESRFRLVPFDE